MGLLDLMRNMSIQRQGEQERRRRQTARNGLIASRAKLGAKRKGSPCQSDGDGTEIYSGPSLPEELCCLIYSFLPMRDAARAACVSRAFLHSWRCHPNLTFKHETLGMSRRSSFFKDHEIALDFSSRVDNILKKHAGMGVKTLTIHTNTYRNSKEACYFNSWLQIAVKPGIEELTLLVPTEAKCNLPCSLLSNGSGYSI